MARLAGRNTAQCSNCKHGTLKLKSQTKPFEEESALTCEILELFSSFVQALQEPSTRLELRSPVDPMKTCPENLSATSPLTAWPTECPESRAAISSNLYSKP